MHSIASSAAAGAIGGAVLALPLALALHYILLPFRRSDARNGPSWTSNLSTIVTLGFGAASGAASGAVGVAILNTTRHGNQMDVLHGARAGALGGAVIGPAILVVGLALVAMCRRNY